MRRFEPAAQSGTVEALVGQDEARVLRSLAEQLAGLLGEAGETESSTDTAVDRILPDAYRDDEEAQAEWRRLSRRALADRKAAFAQRVADDLEPAATNPGVHTVTLDAAGALDWVRAVADLRLVLADRMGIREDGDEPSDALDGGSDLYGWLAWMQDDLVRVLTLLEEER